MRPLYPLKWALNTIPSFFLGHPVNVQLYQDFQNPVWGWLLVATILLFPTLILSSLASSFRAEISVSLQECYYWGPSWPTLIHWVPSQPTVLPHLCPTSAPPLPQLSPWAVRPAWILSPAIIQSSQCDQGWSRPALPPSLTTITVTVQFSAPALWLCWT